MTMESLETNDLYTIRRNGQVLAQSHIVNLGYDQDTLRSLYDAGCVLYCNGKRVKMGRRS